MARKLNSSSFHHQGYTESAHNTWREITEMTILQIRYVTTYYPVCTYVNRSEIGRNFLSKAVNWLNLQICSAVQSQLHIPIDVTMVITA